MPPLVATASLSQEKIDRLRSAFLRAHEEPSLQSFLKAILVERFALPELSAYDETRRRAERVEEAEEWP
jgi:ABC-type phosphate/phosphonate transport system substrate-binding protein